MTGRSFSETLARSALRRPPRARARWALGVLGFALAAGTAFALLKSEALRRWEVSRWSTPRLARESTAHPDDAALQLALGRRLLAAGRGPEAVAAAGTARRARERDPEAWTLYGEAAEATGREQEGVDALQHAVALDPAYPDAYLALARHYQRVGSGQGSIDQLRHYTALRPADPAGWKLMARAFLDLGEPGDARTAAERALDARAPDAEAWTLLARADAMCGDLAAAAAEYRQALRCDRRAPAALVGLATCLLESAGPPAQRQEAIHLLRQAIAVSPDDSDALYELGQALADDGALAEAVTLWQRAVRATPTDARSHHALSQALRRLRRPEDAARHWELFQQLRGFARAGDAR